MRIKSYKNLCSIKQNKQKHFKDAQDTRSLIRMIIQNWMLLDHFQTPKIPLKCLFSHPVQKQRSGFSRVLVLLKTDQWPQFQLQSNHLMLQYPIVTSPMLVCKHGNEHLAPEIKWEYFSQLKGQSYKNYIASLKD